MLKNEMMTKDVGHHHQGSLEQGASESDTFQERARCQRV